MSKQEIPTLTKENVQTAIERLKKDINILSQWEAEKEKLPHLEATVVFLQHLLNKSGKV